MVILYKGGLEKGVAWQSLFAREMPEVSVRIWPDIGEPSEVEFVVAWLLSDFTLGDYPNLKVIFSVGAGVDQLNLKDLPDSIQLVRMLDPNIAKGMAEYVCMSVLNLHRNTIDYATQQRSGSWNELVTVLPENRGVGVMGLGVLGKAVLEKLSGFDFPLFGWSRSAKDIDGVRCFSGKKNLHGFLQNCDILICLLPLTQDTYGILNHDVFASLPYGASLINVGRGGHLSEKDLLHALESGHISAAILDVFENEPLDRNHPFWQHPKILITPHIAAITHTESAGLVLLENIKRFVANKPLRGLVNREIGY